MDIALASALAGGPRQPFRGHARRLSSGLKIRERNELKANHAPTANRCAAGLRRGSSAVSIAAMVSTISPSCSAVAAP
jgi:hypothetical protein